MVQMHRSVIAALIAVWSSTALGQSSPNQPAPSASDVSSAVKTLKGASEFLKAKRAETLACEDKIRASDEFHPIAQRIPPRGAKPTRAQLADKSFITPDESRAMSAVSPKFRECRSTSEDAEASLVPAMGQVWKDYEEKHAAIIADLLARKMTWGGYYRAQIALSARLKEAGAKARAANTASSK
jgi:hypothetical protein